MSDGVGGRATGGGGAESGSEAPGTGRARSGTGTLDVFRYEAEQRLRISAVLAVVLALFGGLYVWIGPQMVTDMDLEGMVEALPPAMRELFGFQSLSSLEGFLASEFYTFGWIVGLGAYVAYSAAGSVAGEIKRDRMDAVLATPVSRRSVLLGKYLSLLVPVVVVNVVVPLALYAMSVLVGAPLVLADLAVLHALSVPYLLCWGAVGLFLGVVVRRGRTAGRVGLGLVFAAWLFESVIASTDYDWLALASPVHYFDPPAVLVDGTVEPAGVAALLGAAVVALVAAVVVFERTDI